MTLVVMNLVGFARNCGLGEDGKTENGGPCPELVC